MSETQRNLDALVARLRAQQTQPSEAAAATNGHARPTDSVIPDDVILEKCRVAKNAAKFSDLFDHGDAHAHHGGDDSSADLALTGRNTQKLTHSSARADPPRPQFR